MNDESPNTGTAPRLRSIPSAARPSQPNDAWRFERTPEPLVSKTREEPLPNRVGRPVESPREIVVAGYSKFPQNTSAEQMHSVLAMVVRVDTSTHRVLDASTTLITDVAQKFLRELLIGRNLISDPEDFVREIQTRYFGHAQRGIVFAFRDLITRYAAILKGEDGHEEPRPAAGRR
jgi:hypothetical protein